jgi:hypothetical protein
MDNPTGVVILSGFAYINQICNIDKIGERNESICSGISGTKYLKRGEYIPNTNTRLQSDNCARPVKLLEKNWNKIKEAFYG